jgi:chromosome partitioning protein
MEPKSKMLANDAAKFLGISGQAVIKNLKTKGLKFGKAQNRVFFWHKTAREVFGIDYQRKTVSFQIVKGGTGKTTLVHSIATRANLYGARVLVIDLDQQGNLTQAFNIDAQKRPVMVDLLEEKINIKDAVVNISEGLDVLPSRIENAVLDSFLMLNQHPLDKVYTNILAEVRGNYDLIIFDCPPALGQSVTAATLASDIVIAPVTPERFSINGLKISDSSMKDISKKFNRNIDFKILINKFDTRTTLSHEVLSTLIRSKQYSKNMFKAYIRNSQEFPNVLAKSESIYCSVKETSAKEDIDLITKEILGVSDN